MVVSVLGFTQPPGHGSYPEGTKASSVILGTLQAHRVMREMLLDGISDFPEAEPRLECTLARLRGPNIALCGSTIIQ
jgi:hypothetical protein